MANAPPSNIATGFPAVPTVPLVSDQGTISQVWFQFLVALWNRTGGASGVLTGAAFGVQQPGLFIASPTGNPGTGEFRTIETSDLPAGQLPGTDTNDNANAGNLGEYIASQVALANAVNLTSATPTDITSIQLSAGDWDVWGSIATAPDASSTTSAINGWINSESATDPLSPNGGCYCNLPDQSIAAGDSVTLPLGMMRVEVPLGSTQQMFLTANVTFAISTLGAYGILAARRAR
jgi:hypothetical protein